MLALARAMLTNPRLLILDEPSEGLAPAVIDQLSATLSTLGETGIAILLAEQNLPLATAVADSLVVLDRGRVALNATTANLANAGQEERLHALVGIAVTGHDTELDAKSH
jgi:branched-chain amino acid transport system ATP-binding protein